MKPVLRGHLKEILGHNFIRLQNCSSLLKAFLLVLKRQSNLSGQMRNVCDKACYILGASRPSFGLSISHAVFIPLVLRSGNERSY